MITTITIISIMMIKIVIMIMITVIEGGVEKLKTEQKFASLA